MELGVVSSTKKSGRQDVAGLGSFLIGAEWRRGDWAYSVQAGVPLVPGLTVQLPITARRFFGDYVYSIASVRPLFTLVGICENAAAKCPRKQQLDTQQDSNGKIVGGFASIGLGVGDRKKPWTLRFEASYLLGYAVGIAPSADFETARTGIYQGIVASLGARF